MRILRALRGAPLPCGCVAGVYETYSGETVALLDIRDQRCADRSHRPGARVELPRTPSENRVGKQPGESRH